jgi:hypothetical protein
MDLIPNSGLDPVADRLLVSLSRAATSATVRHWSSVLAIVGESVSALVASGFAMVAGRHRHRRKSSVAGQATFQRDI